MSIRFRGDIIINNNKSFIVVHISSSTILGSGAPVSHTRLAARDKGTRTLSSKTYVHECDNSYRY